ncbi:hypothetical protein BU14_0331s0009 [Porphyra umbilicalis]|uniref:Uncharacterized protein n=1 Tax=Porphyra umbilicalis TaxID=2786 RepID=A0A1X6NYJ3_PORUM|nr:hypothetical protein BU14_0331s0009 [Porphyra umbilicalis]|eukprot:OSX73691.1 hypothetical protein BU14_0331s0009 [Porphyra umbilicalis]
MVVEVATGAWGPTCGRGLGRTEVQRLVFRRPPPPLGDASVQWAPEPDEPLLTSAWPSLSLTTATAGAFTVIVLDNGAVPPTPAPADVGGGAGGASPAGGPPDAVAAFVRATAAYVAAHAPTFAGGGGWQGG